MKLSTVLTTTLAIFSVALGAAAGPAEGQLEIETLFKPEECLLKSQKGDKLSMQYVLAIASFLGSRAVANTPPTRVATLVHWRLMARSSIHRETETGRSSSRVRLPFYLSSQLRELTPRVIVGKGQVIQGWEQGKPLSNLRHLPSAFLSHLPFEFLSYISTNTLHLQVS